MVDHFQVLRPLGRGGMAEVYLARDTKLGRKVALKVVRRDGLGSPGAVERFLFEARVTARFNHPHIVTIHFVGELAKDQPYVALEFLEGQTLRERLDGERLAPTEAVRIALAVAQALEAAHARSVLHRDLKPENVMLAKDGRLRVLDFGLARVLDAPVAPDEKALAPEEADADLFRSRTQGLRGTPPYMAPEQWQQREVSSATDVWSLGVVLYELLAGRRPYAEPTIFKLAMSVASAEPAPSLCVEGISPQIAALVDRCLDKDPGARPAAAEVVACLRQQLGTDRVRRFEEESPFRGLQPFAERHADLFFGREAEVAAFLERLRDQPLMPVVGPSGAGKSSFVQAGVLPRLREGGRWVVLSFRPGDRPFETLADRLARGESQGGSGPSDAGRTLPALAADRGGLEGWAAELRAAPGRLALDLAQIAAQAGGRALLFVDQLEEIYALCPDAEARRRFMDAVCGAADDPQGPVRVIFTLRDDFLGRLAETEPARAALSRITVLRSPDPALLRETVTRPLEQAGYGYEDPSLVDEMVASVEGEAACLPLLQFCCSRLWEQRDRARRMITRASYAQLGGVEGALARHADGVLEGLTPSEVALARSILLRLVTAEGTRRVLPRSAVVERLGAGAGEVLDRLTAGRVVQARRARSGEEQETELELAHESLIDRWGRLSRWIEAGKEELAFLAEAGQAAALWERRGCREDEVWQGEAMQDAQRRARAIPSLPALVDRFMRAGAEHDRRRKRRRRMARIVGIALLALAAVGSALVAYALRLKEGVAVREKARAEAAAAQARRKELEAELSLAKTFEEKAQRLLADKRLLEARIFAAASLLHNPANPNGPRFEPGIGAREGAELRTSALSIVHQAAQSSLLRLVKLSASGPRAPSSVGVQGFPFIVWQRRDRWLRVTSDGTITVGDAEGRLTRELRDTSPLTCAAASPRGSWIAAGAMDGVVRLWRDATGSVARRLGEPAAAVRSLAVSPDGQLLAAGATDGVVRTWDTTSWKPRWTTKSQGRGPVVVFSSDSRRLAGATVDGWAALWDARTGLRQARWKAREGIETLSFSPDDRLLAAAGADMTAQIWSVPARRLLRSLSLEGQATAIAFSPEGSLLMSASNDGALRLWDTRTWTPIEAEMANRGEFFAALSADGQRVVSAGSGWIRIWEVTHSRLRRTLPCNEGLTNAIAASADGAHLAAGGWGREICIWQLRSSRLERKLQRDWAETWGLAFGPDGEWLASVGGDRLVLDRLHAPEKVVSVRFQGTPGADLVFVDSGRRLGFASGHQVVFADVGTGRTGRAFEGYNTLAISTDERWLATSRRSAPTHLLIYDLTTGKLVHEREGNPDGVWAAAFSPDGRWLATAGGQGALLLWDTSRHTSRRVVGHHMMINRLQFSPDSRLLATASDDKTVRVRSVASGETLLTFRASTPVGPVRFLPDGQTLAMADHNTVKLYSLDFSIRDARAQDLLDQAQRAAGMELEGASLVTRRR